MCVKYKIGEEGGLWAVEEMLTAGVKELLLRVGRLIVDFFPHGAL